MKRLSLSVLSLAALLWPAGLLAQSPNADPRAVDASIAHFRANARAYGLTDPASELRVRSGRRDQTGVNHIRFDQYYKGVKVFEGEAISHVDAAGNVTVTNSLRGNLNLNTEPTVREGSAVATVINAIRPRGPFDAPSVALEILPQGQRSSSDRLVWHARVFIENDDETAQWDYFVDAHTGAIVWSFNSLETATGTGRTMYSGDRSIITDAASGTFYLRDLDRGYTCDQKNKQGGPCNVFSRSNNIFGNGQRNSTDRATAGADAHFGMAATWDYFLNTFERNGINGAGKTTYARTHYGKNYQNAFWSDSCFCMTYGDGGSTFYPLVSIDVAGHEMAHGVMASESKLTYSGESGGLNESSSDIFGTLVEFSVSGLPGNPDTAEYWIGERIYKANYPGGVYAQTVALRYMDDPHKDGISPACWSSGIGSLNVHYSSGPNNHMFYLLAQEGGTNTGKCNSTPVPGIGRGKAAKIWYEAISNYMTSSTNYHGARTACLNAAAALYGGVGSAEYNAVAAAYSAIGVD